MAVLSEGAEEVQVFRYPQSGIAAPSGWEQIISGDLGSSVSSSLDGPADSAQEGCDARELERAFEQGREKGISEGRRLERVEQSAQMEQTEIQRNDEVKRISERYNRERDQLLRAIEPDVVKLALRIAERIVRREVQVDPLVLTGAVRAALGQLADKSKVRVRVPEADANLWSETFAHLPNLRVEPAVVADAQLQPGECVLESDYGVADLGVGSQLEGIARGLLGELRRAPEIEGKDDRTAEEARR